MKKHPYCYPGTDVLRNKEDIQDRDALEVFERIHSQNRLETLPRGLPVTPASYCAIHRYMLQDVYDWAGEYRFVDTGRTGPFCKAEFIAAHMDKRFALIHAEDNLRGLDASRFAARVAEHASELNAIHPFLDGDGRVLRAFLEDLAEQAGHGLDLSRIEPQAWNEASSRAFHKMDHDPLRDVIARATEAISAWLLCAEGRSNALMPGAQFDPFEKLDKPILQADGQAAAYNLWHQLSDERNAYLHGVDAELIGKPKAGG